MKKILFIVTALTFLFSACKKDDSINVVIEGIVMDAATNQLQDSVKVELFTQNKNHVVYTNESGFYSLGSYPVGDYVIVYSKKGYVSGSEQVKSSSYLSAGDFGYNIVKSLMTYLTPANEDAVLTVYRQYQNGERLAAANFPYTINPGGYNSAISGTTDGNGIISLKNQPREFTLSVDYLFNGVRYKTSGTIDTRQTNSVVVYGYNPEASLGIVSSNVLDLNGKSVQDFVTTSSITVQFTLPVDTLHAVYSILEDGWSRIPVNHKWSNGQMKLEIIPKTILVSKTYYNLTIEVENEKRTQSLDRVLSFTTK